MEFKSRGNRPQTKSRAEIQTQERGGRLQHVPPARRVPRGGASCVPVGADIKLVRIHTLHMYIKGVGFLKRVMRDFRSDARAVFLTENLGTRGE